MTARSVVDIEPAPPRRRAPPRGATRSSAQRDVVARCVAALAREGRVPTPVQSRVFEALGARRALLVVAPTGSGKTAAVMLPLLASVTRDAAPRRLRVIYLAPVRALVDAQRLAVEEMARALDAPVRVASRTGDTPARARKALLAAPPDVLVTTPESLAVMLATDARAALATASEVVLDEVHLLASGKRGALLGATLATLDALVRDAGLPPPRRVAMSATAEPLGEIAAWVADDAHVIRDARAAASLSLLDPVLDAGHPSSGWTWRAALPALARAVAAQEGATLVFVSSRARAEQWSLALRDVLPARIGVACFHGSLSAEERARVAEGLRDGALRVVVATSALEVGVDLPRVTEVVLLGAPTSIQRATQAAGRADHRPGAAPHARVLPLGVADIVRTTAARDAVAAGAADDVELRTGDLDVAVQAALGRVALGPCAVGDIAAALREAPAFRALTDDDLAALLDFLTTGGDAFAAYPEMARVVSDGARVALASRRSHVRYLRGVGTILGELSASVIHGSRLVGEVEGRFASMLEPGDRFVLAGRVWRVTSRSATEVYVRPDSARDRSVPAWDGGRAAMSERLAAYVERAWGELAALSAGPRDESLPAIAARLGVREASAEPVRTFVRAQARGGAVPSPERFVVEVVREADRVHVVAFTFAGSTANEVIARAVAVRAREAHGGGADVSARDECACVTLPWRGRAPTERTLRGWLSPDGLRDALDDALEGSSLASACFREVARVAQLWLPDARKGAVTPSLLHDVLRRHDPDHVLLRALRHTVWTALDGPRAERVLAERARRDWVLRVVDAPSALAIPSLAWARRDQVAPADPEAALLDAAHRLYLATLAPEDRG